METNKWYVGQQVWDKTVSDEAGEIIDILEDCFYPVKVFFNHRTVYYDLSGKLEFNKFSTLSTIPYKIKMEGFSQEAEEELPKKGDVCWGRHDVDDEWDIGHFMEKDEFGHYILSSCNNRKNSFPNTEITTKNPYEVEEDREPQIGDMVFAWDDDKPISCHFGKLRDIDLRHNMPYFIDIWRWKYCSLKNPLIK